MTTRYESPGWHWYRREMLYRIGFLVSAATASGGGPWFDAAADGANELCAQLIRAIAATN